jgi:hypothetical protein
MSKPLTSQEIRRLEAARVARQRGEEAEAMRRETELAKKIQQETGCSWSEALRAALIQDQQVQISPDGQTVWVHAGDGSTVGRFSRVFGIDVHRTATEQIAGKGQCLHCTHEPAGQAEWDQFCALMLEHHQIRVDPSIMTFLPVDGSAQSEQSAAVEAPEVVSLGKAFMELMLQEIGFDHLEEAMLRNRVEPSPLVCHTHDFCDANMVMADAMLEVTGKEVDVQDDGQRHLWNQAWEYAVRNLPSFVEERRAPAAPQRPSDS